MGFFIVLAAAGILGDLVWRALRLPAGPEAAACKLLAGAVAAGWAAAIAGFFSTQAALWSLAALAVLGLMLTARPRRRPVAAARESQPCRSGGRSLFERVCVAATGTGLALAFVGAWAPETGWEAVTTHLAAVKEWQRAGRLVFAEGQPHAAPSLPALALYSAAFTLGGETSAALLSWSFCVLACWLLHGAGTRLWDRKHGRAAAAMCATMPLLYAQAGTVSVDMLCATLLLGALVQLLVWRDARPAEGGQSRLVLAGLLAGTACAVRTTAIPPAGAMALATLLWAAEPRWRWAGIFAGTALLAALPPMAPAAWAWLQGWTPSLAPVYDPTARALPSPSGSGLAWLAWDLAMRPWRYGGWAESPGPWMLAMAIPAAVGGGKTARNVGLGGLAALACLYWLYPEVRMLTPALLPLVLIAPVWLAAGQPGRRVLACCVVLGFGMSLAVQAWALRDALPVLTGREAREDYVERHMPGARNIFLFNRQLPAAQRVLSADPRAYYFHAPVYYRPDAIESLAELTPQQQAAWLHARAVQHVYLPHDPALIAPKLAGEPALQLLAQWWRHPGQFRLVQRLPGAQRESGAQRASVFEVAPQ